MPVIIKHGCDEVLLTTHDNNIQGSLRRVRREYDSCPGCGKELGWKTHIGVKNSAFRRRVTTIIKRLFVVSVD